MDKARHYTVEGFAAAGIFRPTGNIHPTASECNVQSSSISDLRGDGHAQDPEVKQNHSMPVACHADPAGREKHLRGKPVKGHVILGAAKNPAVAGGS